MRQSLERHLTAAWTRRGPTAWVLWPLSKFYSALVGLRRALYQSNHFASHRLPVPVIVVGNVVAGGAGKTPVVMALVQHLVTRGLQVGVVSRGYGRLAEDCREVTPQSNAHEVGDEPLLIKRRCNVPVFVAGQRIDAAKALLAAYPAVNCIVGDDGLQHLALQRDLEICVFDDRGVGNGFLLPAGPLRQAWPPNSSANQGQPGVAQLILHTGHHPAFEGGFKATRQLADHAVRADGNQIALTALAHTSVVALAGIANPEAFFEMLRAAGLNLVNTEALPDHYNFDSYNTSKHGGNMLVCTEKDAMKLWPHDAQAWAVPLEFAPEPAFFAAIDAWIESFGPKLSSRHGTKTT
jgi:tetraacyldisaccharide 4'-kinase